MAITNESLEFKETVNVISRDPTCKKKCTIHDGTLKS